MHFDNLKISLAISSNPIERTRVRTVKLSNFRLSNTDTNVCIWFCQHRTMVTKSNEATKNALHIEILKFYLFCGRNNSGPKERLHLFSAN